MHYNVLNLIFTILSISIVVIFHELGHYVVARINKVEVKEFSIGFGPDIVSYVDQRGTKWIVKMFPLGGYVHCEEGDLRFFSKILLYLGGPIGNFIFSILVGLFLFSHYGYPEQKLYLNNQEIAVINKMDHQYKARFADKTEQLLDEQILKNVRKEIVYKKIGFVRAIRKSFQYVCNLVYFNIANLSASIRNLSLKGIGGPLRVLQATNCVISQYKFDQICTWLLVLSVGLGVINLLPILPLDGGRIVYELISLINKKIAKVFCSFTMYLAFGIMLLVLFADFKGMLIL